MLICKRNEAPVGLGSLSSAFGGVVVAFCSHSFGPAASLSSGGRAASSAAATRRTARVTTEGATGNASRMPRARSRAGGRERDGVCACGRPQGIASGWPLVVWAMVDVDGFWGTSACLAAACGLRRFLAAGARASVIAFLGESDPAIPSSGWPLARPQEDRVGTRTVPRLIHRDRVASSMIDWAGCHWIYYQDTIG